MELSQFVLEPLREDEEFILYRGARQGSADASPRSLLLLAPVSMRPGPHSLKKLEHEYALRTDLDPAWAVRPVALSRYEGRTMLALENPGGEPLEQLIQEPMEVAPFLRVAAHLAAALSGLHKRGLIHKDLKPAHVLVNVASGDVRLMGFGIASRLPRERQPPEPPEFIAGTLPYMAPEQTGRMNRSIDSRTDLYALGVTLYEMLTGSLPFTASEPMEWVHCHIARQPVPLDERRPDVPAPVSAIIARLLAKTAEDRYQTAAGVEADLRWSLAEWESRRQIDTFLLGTRDRPDRLLIPEKLYGRVREIETLLRSFDRVVADGTAALVLVSGYSGIGKSSVVNELHKVLVPPRGLFASGKFDQYKRDIPYATVAQAFQSLVRPLLSKGEAELRDWRDVLLKALGPNGRLIVTLVPELTLIIGEQPPVPDLPPQDAQARFQLVFRRFIGVFARPEHPLALFLDDLQWLDAATLDLLEDVLTHSDVQHLLVIGAYRDNEVNSAHPLARKLAAIRQAGAPVHEIVLAPLARDDLKQLIADSVNSEPERVLPLAELVHDKTAGNPFFAIQFISALTDEALLTFDHREGEWSWELERIHTKGYTDNVVDLMAGKLHRLSADTQKILQELACLGNVAEIGTLAVVHETPEQDVHRALWEAVRLELVVQSESAYKFIHDRVQEAAYSLIPEALRAEAHLRLGRLLTAHTPLDKREESIFEIVSQLNRGADLIASSEERERVAELNFIAGKRAKTSTAYASALAYLAAGRSLLTDGGWNDHRYELMFGLEYHLAECELLTADMAAAEARLSMLARQAKSVHHVAAVARLRLTLYTTLDRSDRGVDVCLDYLRRDGTHWSAHPTTDEVLREYDRIWSLVGSRPIEELIEQPLMTDPESLAALDVLTEVVTPALFTDENLASLVICRMVNLSLERGNSDGSCFAYVWFAIIAGPRFGNYKDGFRFGRLGYDLVEQRGLTRYQARTYMSFGNIVMPWKRHIRAGRDLVRRAFDAANRIGDLTFAAYSCNNLNTNLLAAGDPLGDVQHEAEHGLEFAQSARFGLVVDIITAQLGLIRTLRGLTPTFGSFNDERFDERRFEQHLSSDPVLALPECWYWIRKMQARFLAGDYASATDASLRAQRLVWTSPSLFETAEFQFYSALCHAASWEGATADQRVEHLEALTAHHRQLAVWADNCPENFENRLALVSAEMARINGHEVDAQRLYEQAISSARIHGFVQNEALANELAGRFYAARGFERIARLYLQDARYDYLRWGAAGKVRQLDQQFPHLKEEEPGPAPISTIGAPVEHLDLATVIKVSQAVSGEIVLEKLIDTLMRTAIEHAGAQRGLLILPRGHELQIEAEATTDRDTVVVRLFPTHVTLSEMPESILQYVVRTQESVILDDASAPNQFSDDEYIRQRHPRSVFCLPLVKQSTLIGVLYLENNLTPRVFTPATLAVLKLLASQAAISLENTRLYRDLEEREARIRRLVDANIIGICIWTLDGTIIDANDAFLQMVGYARDDLASNRLRWTDMTPTEWREADERAVAELQSTGTFRPVEKEYYRKDGSRLPVLIGGAKFEGRGNEGVAFVLDLSEQKRTAEALRRSQAYLAEAQRLSHIGSWACNIRRRQLHYSSEEHSRLYGFEPGSHPSFEDFYERVHPADRARVMDAYGTAIDSGADVDVHYRVVLPDGTMRRVQTVGHPVITSDGDSGEFVGFLIDVTERRRADEERERLRQAQADLAHVTRVTTMGELTASLAHEIKQPLSAVMANAQACLRWLGRREPELEEAHLAASRIVRDVTRAGEIISRISLLFKKGALPREWVDVNELIREMMLMLRGEAARYDVILRDALELEAPKVMADRVQLQQVLMNLMLNGIDAMKHTGGRHDLTIASVHEQDQVVISVSDTGAGVAPELLDQIFTAFFTTKDHGTGMGLAISRSIVESHGGRLWVAANAERGATFRFSLPCAYTLPT